MKIRLSGGSINLTIQSGNKVTKALLELQPTGECKSYDELEEKVAQCINNSIEPLKIESDNSEAEEYLRRLQECAKKNAEADAHIERLKKQIEQMSAKKVMTPRRKVRKSNKG